MAGDPLRSPGHFTAQPHSGRLDINLKQMPLSTDPEPHAQSRRGSFKEQMVKTAGAHSLFLFRWLTLISLVWPLKSVGSSHDQFVQRT